MYHFKAFFMIFVDMFATLKQHHVNVYLQFPKFRKTLEGSRHYGAD